MAEPRTLAQLLQRNAKDLGDRPAIREKDRGIWQSYTWRHYLAEARLIALGLASIGFSRGDRTAIVGDNRPQLYWAMNVRKLLVGPLALALLAAPTVASVTAQTKEMFVPSTVYRTGPYAPSGTPFANGFWDYLTLINERDGGVNGVKLLVEECETQYDTKQGVECYERLKGKGGGAILFNPLSTGITYQLIPKAAVDKVPVHSMGYGMATIGLASILRGVGPTFLGAGTKTLPLPISDEPIVIGPLFIPPIQLLGAAVSLIFLSGFGWFFLKSRKGIAMRAVADNQQVAMAMGINVERYFGLAWAMTGIVSALGGIIWGNLLGVDVNLSLVGFKVFPVVILGGLDSIPGAIIGGLIVGVVENVAAGYVDPYVGGGTKDFAPYVLMIVALMIRPYGMFGKKIIERV